MPEHLSKCCFSIDASKHSDVDKGILFNRAFLFGTHVQETAHDLIRIEVFYAEMFDLARRLMATAPPHTVI